MTTDDTRQYVEPDRVRLKLDMVLPESLVASLDAECARTLTNRVHIVRQLILARFPDHAEVTK